jgi:hypothetical protein
MLCNTKYFEKIFIIPQKEAKMKEDKRQEALESIELIKELVLQTKEHMGHYGGGCVSIIWGVFCFVGVAGQRLLIPHGWPLGIWWTGLSIIAGYASFLISRRYLKTQAVRTKHNFMRYFLGFWLPLIFLGYTLTFFIALSPSLSNHYISIVILLVVSTGYIIIGFMLFRGILYMGIIGYIATVISAIYFLEYSDVILGILFGCGLIITGLIINKQWKNT